jgi:hypothetical protein
MKFTRVGEAVLGQPVGIPLASRRKRCNVTTDFRFNFDAALVIRQKINFLRIHNPFNYFLHIPLHQELRFDAGHHFCFLNVKPKLKLGITPEVFGRMASEPWARASAVAGDRLGSDKAIAISKTRIGFVFTK